MARYLITGAAGFIGSALAYELVARGEEVRGFDNLSTGRMENLKAIEGKIDFRRGDLADLPAVRQACEGVDYILHQGALPSVPKSVKDPITSHRSNVEGTLNVLMAAREAGVKRLTYASSSSIYGETPTLPKTEDMAPSPISPYAVQKLCGEHYMVSFYRVYGLETVSLRYFNVFGPRQDPSSMYSGVLAKFSTAMLTGEQPIIYGDGEQSRDFTYIDNVVQANLKALHAPAAKVAGGVFNAATGTRYTLNQTFEILQRITGYSGKPRYDQPREGDIKHSHSDSTPAREAFGYVPSVGFEEGLERTVAWYREQMSPSGAR